MTVYETLQLYFMAMVLGSLVGMSIGMLVYWMKI